VSIEITEIIWICNVMGFFFKFGKQIEENIGFYSCLVGKYKMEKLERICSDWAEKVCDKVIINKLE
jgi:hypothetical protein